MFVGGEGMGGTLHRQKRVYPHFLTFCCSFVWMCSTFIYFYSFSGQDSLSERAAFYVFPFMDGGGGVQWEG